MSVLKWISFTILSLLIFTLVASLFDERYKQQAQGSIISICMLILPTIYILLS